MNRRLARLLLTGAYTLLGEPVSQRLREFEHTQRLSRAELAALRVQRLRALLERASERSPYYRRALERANLRPADADLGALARLPTLSKDDIRANAAELAGSGPRVRTESRKTSGSTGQPLIFAKSRATTGAMNALMWRNYGWYGIAMADRSARIWAGGPTALARAKTWASDRLQNRIRMTSFALGPVHFDRFIEEMFAFRPRYLYGYGQSLYRLGEYADATGKGLDRLGLAAVISTSEKVSDEQRAVMARGFGAKVANEYGTTETGIIAMDCPLGSMHLADDGLIVEVVKDGAPAEPGEEGEIVVTELYGELMPLIRYRTGDRGVLSDRSCPCGLPFGVLERLSGRVTELLRCPDGSLIDPDLFHPILKSRPDLYAAIRQWRVAQTDASTVRITLCTRGAQPQPDVEALLVERFAALTGARLALAFTYEEWLEPKATGKTL